MTTRTDSLLRLINDIGGEGKHRNFCSRIRDYWDLTQEERDSQAKLFHHVASVEQTLKTLGFVRHHGGHDGTWELTEAGKRYLSSKEQTPPVHIQRTPSNVASKDNRLFFASSGKLINEMISCIESLRMKLVLCLYLIDG